MADHMRAELVCDALRMAIAHRRPAPGAIFHSDRGTQYTSTEFTDLLADHEMIQSLSRPRQCWDNAVAESFFASLKLELHLPALLGHPRPRPPRRVRLHRGVLQPAAAALLARLLTPADYENKIRNTTPLTRHSHDVRRTGSTPDQVFDQSAVFWLQVMPWRDGICTRLAGTHVFSRRR